MPDNSAYYAVNTLIIYFSLFYIAFACLTLAFQYVFPYTLHRSNNTNNLSLRKGFVRQEAIPNRANL